MNREAERENQELGHEAMKPEDQAIMIAPRAYLLGYLAAVNSMGNDVGKVFLEIRSIKNDQILISVGSVIAAVSSIVILFFVVFGGFR